MRFSQIFQLLYIYLSTSFFLAIFIDISKFSDKLAIFSLKINKAIIILEPDIPALFILISSAIPNKISKFSDDLFAISSMEVNSLSILLKYQITCYSLD